MADVKEDSDSVQMKKDPVLSQIASHDVESSQVVLPEESAAVIDSAAEKALCRKFDLRLLPVLAIMVSLRGHSAYKLQCLAL